MFGADSLETVEVDRTELLSVFLPVEKHMVVVSYPISPAMAELHERAMAEYIESLNAMHAATEAAVRSIADHDAHKAARIAARAGLKRKSKKAPTT